MFSIRHLNNIRQAEIARIVSFLTPHTRVLELGAGTGQQASELADRGFQVEAIELASSEYARDRVFPIVDYDGRRIPYPDASFDIVFSSNVLEHVPDLAVINREIARVLRPGGYAVHVMPTPAWRFWTILSAYPNVLQVMLHYAPKLMPRSLAWRAEARRMYGAGWTILKQTGAAMSAAVDGERGNTLTELWYFHPNWWRRNFAENGFAVVHDEPMGLFYTGFMVFGQRWDIESRRRWSRRLGSACHLFKVAPSTSVRDSFDANVEAQS